jgi:hypothetical protein
MRRSTLSLLAITFLVAALPAVAAVETQLYLNAGGVTATIDVNTGGIVTCSGTCGGLTIVNNGDHRTIDVTGTLGTFTIDTTGRGELDTIDPEKLALNQIQVSTGGAGTLEAIFTDTSYANLGNFVLSASVVNAAGIAATTTDFYAYGDAGNAVPAGTLIDSFLGLTGLADADAAIVANTIGASGSLSARTVISFSGAGTSQANFSISSVAIPEPASVVLFGTMLLGTGLGLRRRFGR